MFEKQVVVRVSEGLHARPAARFVQLAKSFSAEIEVVRGEKTANAKSSVKLMLLGVKEDDRIVIRATGDDEEKAVAALAVFAETPDAGLEIHPGSSAPPPAPAPKPAAVPAAAPSVSKDGTVSGVPASEGTAIGPVYAFFREPVAALRQAIEAEEVDSELQRFREAVDAVAASVVGERNDLSTDPADQEILNALIEVIRDGEFVGRIETLIGERMDPVAATLAIAGELAASFLAVGDAYMAARAEDVRGAARLIALKLLGREDVDLAQIPVPSVVVAEEISAFDFAKARLANILGLVCTTGAATSHVAIMARTHGIPAVLGVSADPAVLKAARTAVVDGKSGAVTLDPADDVADAVRARVAAEARERDALSVWRDVEPKTKSGTAIEVAANLGSLKEIDKALAAGAMGVGLFRTEFLFMERRMPPTEDEQAAVYTRLAEAFAPRPVIIRTLDVGGDKPVAGVDFPHEENPFLGWRGIRMCLDRPDFFKTQLSAILRAAAVGNVKIMFPMVVEAAEIRRAKALIEDCAMELRAQGIAHGSPGVGVMLETPAAALMADELAEEVEFFSIGTNDLTQYVMAADRMNPRVAHLNRADHPAVLKAVEIVCRAAEKAGIWVGVCGEAAARPDLIPTFIKLGVRELSMSPPSIPRAKTCVAEAD
ncbi:phosphoenolpyruvate--protein phosphotransferase [Chthonobacter albigriseus]|uniref:phosphoenolpyruvate--protein phosphotransferase n=1 Tax=Chthonobacter albigriseus TaxID=1683161 RepID=UPI0015EF5A9B|nr:phosphoenolpyruvate--protein phosphotransferase [Chthonobacter albigriseus]